jgi:methylthioribose-1-phosphate isomerase
MLPTITWRDDMVVMIDQRKLPLEEVYVVCRTHEEVAVAVETMIIRGAPAIGVAAAYGIALGFLSVADAAGADAAFAAVCDRLRRTRPTARNLFWAIERMQAKYAAIRREPLDAIKRALVAEAAALDADDVAINERIGRNGAELIKDGDTILTHCNAGGLATAGYGTAVGVIRAAFEQGKKIRILADETRPFLQGARLTAYELERLGIPYEVITDNMAGWLMHRGQVSLAVVGADRIARNGDAANKIGTYSVAVLAAANGVPFYVAAPMSTFDFSLATGEEIPIEERPAAEVKEINGRLITPPAARVRNPAFDVTPARYITAIIAETGVFRPPYGDWRAK